MKSPVQLRDVSVQLMRGPSPSNPVSGLLRHSWRTGSDGIASGSSAYQKVTVLRNWWALGPRSADDYKRQSDTLAGRNPLFCWMP